ncbi:MAG: DUF2510 domain-containing protein [Solirubrobacterales bacterium]
MAEESSDASNEPAAGNGEEQSAEAGGAAREDAQAADSSGGADGGEVAASPPEASAETISEAASSGGETPAGWFQDPNVPNQQRYWDGSTWTDQTKESEAGISTTKRSADERKALLARQIQGAAARGLRVESQSEFQAVLVEGQPVNHVLHAIITIFSCGLWGIAWIILAVTGGEKREMIVVDEFGNVQLQKLGKT